MPATVSVVICNYNYEKFLLSAVDSVLKQSHPPAQVIVVDDGSTDGSLAAMNKYVSNPLVHLHSQQNGGQYAAYNAGFLLAKGDVVIFLDADDLLAADTLERLLPVFEDTAVSKVHWRMRLIDADGNDLGGCIPYVLDEGFLGNRLLEQGILYSSAPGSGNAYRRSVLEKLFPLPEDPFDRHGADFFAIYGASLIGSVKALKGIAGAYRNHADVSDVRSSLAFGNAAKAGDESAKTAMRSERFQRWVRDRLALEFKQAHFVDFSMIKSAYAIEVAGVRWGFQRLAKARKLFPRFRQGVQSREDFGIAMRWFFYAWAFIVSIFPGRLGLFVAAIVTNPGARPKLVQKT